MDGAEDLSWRVEAMILKEQGKDLTANIRAVRRQVTWASAELIAGMMVEYSNDTSRIIHLLRCSAENVRKLEVDEMKRKANQKQKLDHEVNSEEPPVSDYVDYLLAPSTPLDFNIVIGNPESNDIESIGVVKWMLIARSKVLRAMMLESPLRSEKEFNIIDIDPKTFRHFLEFLYGRDRTSCLTFQDAMKLLAVAEKYDVQDLKSALGRVMKSCVTVENTFTALRDALVCEQLPEVWEMVTEVIQFQTREVLSHPEFLSVSPEVVLYIVQQECLSIPEIDVWRAVLQWAKHQVRPKECSTSTDTLRSIILPFLKHIRLRTLNVLDIFAEDELVQILTSNEEVIVFDSIWKTDKNKKFAGICNEIVPRRLQTLVSDRSVLTYSNRGTSSQKHECRTTSITLQAKQELEVCAIVCMARDMPTSVEEQHNTTYICEGHLHIFMENPNPIYSTYNLPFEIQVEYGNDFVIPFEVINKKLFNFEADGVYRITCTFTDPHPARVNSYTDSCHMMNDLEVGFEAAFSYSSHIRFIHFKTIPGGKSLNPYHRMHIVNNSTAYRQVTWCST